MAETQVQESVPEVTVSGAATGVERSIRDILGRSLASWVGVNAALCDFLVIAGLHLAAAVMYSQVFNSLSPFMPLYVGTALLFALTYCTVAALQGRYTLKELEFASKSALEALKLFNIIFAIFVCLLFLSKGTFYYSRGSFVLQYVAVSIGLFGSRTAMAVLIRSATRRGRIEARRIAVVGPRASCNTFGTGPTLLNRGVVVSNAFVIPEWKDDGFSDASRAEMEALAARITADLRRSSVDDIVIVMPWRAAPVIEMLVRRFSALPAQVHLASDPELTWLRSPVLAEVGDEVTISLSRPPLTVLDRAMKRIMDVTLASLILLATMPLMLAIAIAIRLDSRGPVLFRQQRHGFNQKPFRILKFRTMTTLDDGDVVRQACKGDSRITRVGSILRRTSLDELPQLLNVIKGDMSLVGPRPHALAHDREYEEKIALYAHRHNVKPGITGWAQVHGFRGQTDVDWKMQKRVEFDLAYIDNWSILLDFQILFLTVFSRKTFHNAF
jgi:Undecaprenyl-phosphate glucose phosphotransferase